MINVPSSLSEATGTQRHTRRGHLPITTTTSAAFTIVPLTDALLALLEPVEAASYPESYREGVAGYAKRLHATPPCPSFVCLQRTRSEDAQVDMADLVAVKDVARLRAIGYAITCRMPRRSASLLLRDEDGGDDENMKSGGVENGEEEESGDDACAVLDNRKAALGADAADLLPLSDGPCALSAQHPPKADTFYIHDVAVHPDFRGLGVAAALWAKIEEARVELRLKRMSLVAVFGASTYWARHGFREVARKALPEETVRVLDDYGEHAVFMERED